MTVPTLFYDLGSPYSYLSVERAEAALGMRPRLHPTLLGPIFALRGWGSWGHGPDRVAHQAEIEARAARYGLPPVRWPPGWPPNTLTAMRAVTWAQRHDRGDAYARAAFRAAFVDGADLGDVAILEQIADQVGLPPGDLASAVRDPAIKEALGASTQEAIDRGVRGAPTLDAGGVLIYGDDRLEEAITEA